MSDSQWQSITMTSFEPPKLKNNRTLEDWVLENKCRYTFFYLKLCKILLKNIKKYERIKFWDINQKYFSN